MIEIDVPPLVSRALRSSLERGYLDGTRSETGRLLATLAATRTGTIAECGTGCGIGAAWLRSGAPAGTRVITAELDEDLATRASATFCDDGIEVVHADWSHLGEHGPFSLIFIDAETLAHSEHAAVLDLLEVGGMLVVDNLASGAWGSPAAVAVRADWLREPRLVTSEVLVAADAGVMLGVRRS